MFIPRESLGRSASLLKRLVYMQVILITLLMVNLTSIDSYFSYLRILQQTTGLSGPFLPLGPRNKVSTVLPSYPCSGNSFL